MSKVDSSQGCAWWCSLRYCSGHGLCVRYGLWIWVDPARGVSTGVELVWGGGGVDGWRVSLKSGFQLNPWLSSKRTRKMTEVHDMVRSPHPAKPFHFGPFVSLQLLIFMIAPPDITPTSGPDLTATPAARTKWTGLKNKVGRLERQKQKQTARFHCISEKYPHGKRENDEDKEKEKDGVDEDRDKENYHSGWNISEAKKSNDSHIIFCSQTCWLLSFCPQFSAFLWSAENNPGKMNESNTVNASLLIKLAF